MPTIVITAVILMMVLVAALSSVASVRRSLNDQYYNQLAREASEAGFEFAQGCLRKNNGTVTWSAAQPLRPNTDCTGGAACTGSSSCYVMSTSTVRTSFTVGDTVLRSGTDYLMNISAKTELLQESISAVRYTYNYSEQQALDLVAQPVYSGLVLSLDAADLRSYPGTGTAWYDLSGNNNTASLLSGVVYNSGSGGYMKFDGVSSYASSSFSTTAISNVTMQGWVYIPTTLQKGAFMKTGSASSGYAIGVGNGVGFGSMGNTLMGLFPGIRWINTNTALPVGWNFVTLVLDGSSTPTIYLNSTRVGSYAGLAPLAPSGPLAIGRNIGDEPENRTFTGGISTVYFYNRALSYSEVQQNFISQRSRYYDATRTSCLSILKAGLSTGSGIYTINPSGTPLSVYCDMTTGGGGWTLVLQNNLGVTTPSPSWNDSIYGNTITGTLSNNVTTFDQLVGLNYWNTIGTQMRVQLGNLPTAIVNEALYSFYIDPTNSFSINMSNENVTVGGSEPGIYTYHNGRPWTTYDVDNDASTDGNCALNYSNHPWWYGSCWSGNFFAGGSGYQEMPYWSGSGGMYGAYGSIWVR